METWKTSSYTNGNGGHCVEVAQSSELVKVRDTKNRHHGFLAVPIIEWTALVTALKNGEEL